MSGDREDPDDFYEKHSGWHSLLGWGDKDESLAPYVPTPQSLVHTMLEMAEAGSGDVVYDLGCGDGRILITAVRDYNVEKAVGFEINQHLVQVARDNVEKSGLSGRIKIYDSDFMEADFSEASLVSLYLTTSGNALLRPKLKKELKEGARIVSHDFPITSWVTTSEDGDFVKVGTHKIYLYTIPDAYTRKIEKDEENSTDRWGRIRRLFDRL